MMIPCEWVIVIFGGTTVTVKLQLDEWPQASVATQWTVVVEFGGNRLHGGGVQTRVTLGLQLS